MGGGARQAIFSASLHIHSVVASKFHILHLWYLDNPFSTSIVIYYVHKTDYRLLFIPHDEQS